PLTPPSGATTIEAPAGRGADRKVRTTVPTPAVSPDSQTASRSVSTSRTPSKVGSIRDTGSASGLFGRGAAGLCACRGNRTPHVGRGHLDARRTVAQGTRRPAVRENLRRARVHSRRPAPRQQGGGDPGPAAADRDRGDRGGTWQATAADRGVERVRRTCCTRPH